MTIEVSVTNEAGCIEQTNSYDDVDEAFEAIDVLEDFGYVTQERPAVLSYGTYTVEVRPEATNAHPENEKLAEGYRERAERSQQLAEEMAQASSEATGRLGEASDRTVDVAQKLTEGDVVRDEDPVASWARGQHFEVVEATNVRADEYVIAEDGLTGRTTTVADKNPAYDDSEPVIIVTPVNGSDKEYAYPASRLTKVPEHLL